MAQLNVDGFNKTELASEGSYPDWSPAAPQPQNLRADIGNARRQISRWVSGAELVLKSWHVKITFINTRFAVDNSDCICLHGYRYRECGHPGRSLSRCVYITVNIPRRPNIYHRLFYGSWLEKI